MHVSTASLSDGAPGFEANMPEIYNDKNAKGDSSNPFFDLADSTLDNAIDSGKFNDVLSEQNIDISTPQGRLDAKQYLNDNCAQEVYSSDNTYVKDALKSNSKYSDFSSCSNMVNGEEKEAQGIVGLKVSSSVNQHSNVIVRNNDLVTQGSESTITNGNRVAEKIISSNKNNAKTGN